MTQDKSSEAGLASYEAPQIEVSTFMVEQGFQNSETATGEDGNWT